MNLRTKEYELTAGQVRQVKVQDIQAPVRFLVESGSFNYEILLNNQVIVASTGVASGVLVAPDGPGGAFGSEIRITCATAGTLHVAYMG
jgi:hypothetical protein